MQKEKCLTSEDITLLISENWLTSRQQSEFDIYEGVVKTWNEIEKFCPDQTVLNFIFKETKIEPINIRYNVVTYYYGEQTNFKFFDNINDAVIERQELIKSTHPDNVRIEIYYDLKGSN